MIAWYFVEFFLLTILLMNTTHSSSSFLGASVLIYISESIITQYIWILDAPHKLLYDKNFHNHGISIQLKVKYKLKLIIYIN